MNEKAKIMRKEILAIASYRALAISKYFITLLLAISSFYLEIIRYPLSPIYILLMLNILPPILNYAFKDYTLRNKNNKLLAGFFKDIPFHLTMLKRKYHYSKSNYVANSIAYLFSLFLICLWQYNYYNAGNISGFNLHLPFAILIAGILLRFLAIVAYQFKLPYDLTHNKL